MQIDIQLVRRLVAAQFPQWASLAVEVVESVGWDNAIFRLGSELAVRLPRRRVSADHVRSEQLWLPVLAPHLPLPVPVPLGHGVPGEGYPWHWTVCPWLTGDLAALTQIADPGQAAMRLAQFVAALQVIDPAGGSVHEFRGVSLAAHDDNTRASAAVLRDSVDTSSVLGIWETALAAPAWTGQPLWMHGDLHPANLLVAGNELSAVIDFGLLGVGDPACDLMVAWTFLSADSRDVFRRAVAVDDATWARGRAWALEFGLRVAANSADNPLLDDIGWNTLAEVLADFNGDQPQLTDLPADTVGAVRAAPETCWLHPDLEVRQSPIAELGLFSTADIAAGTVVARLGGQLVTHQELRARFDAAAGEPEPPYIDTILVADDLHLVLPPGQPIHYGNHSCDPNLWWVDEYTLTARRLITAGEEVTSDYGTSTGDANFTMACSCRSPLCRGSITGKDWQRTELQLRYQHHWVPALLQRIRAH